MLGGVLAAPLLGVLVITGKIWSLVAGTMMAWPLIQRLRHARQQDKAARGGRGGQASQVATDFLRMRLDHATGAMDGEVLAGRYQGANLSALGRAELEDLLAELRPTDTQSAALIEAYLDRVHPDWRQGPSGGQQGGAGGQQAGAGGRRKAGSTAMSREEAYAVLGLQTGASAEEIRQAHRRLMRQMHPDAGGSDFLAAQVNRAKETLLGE